MKTHTPVILTLVIGAGLALPLAASAQDPGAAPRHALAITDPAVANYGVRARLSGKYFDKVKFAARDMLGKFSEPKSTMNSNFHSEPGGFNTVLDPGYDLATHNAGGVRTTPVQLMWSWRSDIPNGATCTPVNSASCAPINKDLSRRFHWLQARKYGVAGSACNRDDIIAPPAAACANAIDGAAVAGGVLCNQRGVPPYWQGNHKEHGFYTTADDSHCFDAQNVCMSNMGLPTRTDGRDPGGWCYPDTCTTHQFNELGTICDMEAQFADPAKEIYMNVGVFIFPNGFVENAGSGANAGFLGPIPPAWARPRTLNFAGDGDYFGYIPVRRFGVYTGRGGAIGTFAPTSHPLRQSAGTDPNGLRWYASGYPSGAANYNERNYYDELFGSYFRMGDDIAFYADVRQMQIHSIERDADSVAQYGAAAVAGCGFAPVYTGQTDGSNEPLYFFARVPQCLRPKSYWDAAKLKWVACNPYDTFLEDGVTLNPARDDANPLYPGRNYPVGSQTVCGAQTSQMSPFTSAPPVGTGWSALRIDTLNLDTTNNKVDFTIQGDEWRLELAMLFDFATECTVTVPYISTSPSCGGNPGYQAKRKWAMGAIMIRNLLLQGTAKLYSVDSYSCGQTNGGCPDANAPELPWQLPDDGLIRPDKLFIDLDLNTTQITLHPDPDPAAGFNAYGQTRNAIRAVYQDLSNDGYSCYAEVYSNCAFTLAKGTAGSQANPQLLVPQITDALRSEFENQFADLINGIVDDLNASIPNLGAIFGDPWNFGHALIDVGLFLTGASGDSVLDTASRRIWPVRFLAPPAGRKPVIDINASIGFRPIAFRPPNAQGAMLVDATPNIDKTPPSFYAVPTMVAPDTAACYVTVAGPGAVPISTSGAAANTWIASNTTFSYNNPTGWVYNVGTVSGRNFGRFFFNRTNWKWSRITDVSKANMNPIAGVTGNAYRIEANRTADFPSTNWGISDGWIQLNTTFTQGNAALVRVGDQFWLNGAPTAKYTIKAVNAANRAVQLDLLAGFANRTTPLTLSNAAAYTIKSRRCAGADSRYPAAVTEYDFVDHMLETFNWVDPKTGENYSAAGSKRVISPYYMAPYTTAPAWCMTPKIQKQEEAAMAARYPMTTWLSFNSVDLKPPGATTMVNPSPWARHTLGDWDFIPGAAYGARGIVRQNQNDPNNKEPGAVDYDASVHIHQRALNQLALALVSSGAACIEFADTDPDTGAETPWASFLTTTRFAAVFPELQIKYPNAKIKLRISPQAAPHVRTGIGTISYTPGPGIVGSPAIVNEPYTLGVALPDLQLGVTVVDPATNMDVDVFKMNWNTVVGLYLRSMRVCHPNLDPDRNADKCTPDPTKQLLRTVSGYWQLYVDYGNDNLGLAFEAPANAADGFSAGRFTRSEFVCNTAGCKTNVNPGTAKFQVLQSFCGTGCNTQGIAQSLITLLDAAFSLYLDTRASTEFLSMPLAMDILYVGPDGPNDDALGASTFGSRGDYLGVYVRQFGNLDLAKIMGGLSFAPTLIPQAVIPALENVDYLNTNSPSLAVALRGADAQQSEYTYRLDGGFWRTPRSAENIELSALTEGAHVVEIRSLVPTANGSVPQAVPTRMAFKVDTLPPEVHIPPAKRGTYDRSVALQISDLQTPADKLVTEFSLDDGAWVALEEPTLSLSGVGEGRHTLRVRATDLAGNTGESAREIVVGRGAGCGGCASSEATAEVLLLSLLVMLALRRRHAAVTGKR